MALVAFVAMGATAMLLNRHTSGGSIRKLARIVGPHRVARGRLSGGFAFAPCVADADTSRERLVRDLACGGPPPTSWSSAGELREYAESRRSAERDSASSAHEAGVWELVMGHPDAAVEELREAARVAPSDARVLNDLATALASAAQAQDDPWGLIDAFVAADSAVRLDSTLAEAAFTQAVLLEALQLPEEARAAWSRYLRLDDRSPWAAEARTRLAALAPSNREWEKARERLRTAALAGDSAAVHAIVADFPSQAGLLVQRQLAEWGASAVARDSASSRTSLDAARLVAGPLRQTTGDAQLADAIATIDSARREASGERLRLLAAGHTALGDGVRLFDSRRLPEADRALAEARRLLGRAGSPMALTAELYAAKIRLSRNEMDAALHAFRGIRDTAPASYLVLRSGAAQMMGLIYDTRSDYVHVVSAYDSAVAEGRTIREPETSVRVRSWLAPKAAILRGREAGWRVLYATLRATPEYPASVMVRNAVFASAAQATSRDAPRLSLRYLDQMVRQARSMGQPDAIASALTLRGSQLAQMHESSRARADVDSAIAAARLIPDSAFRATMLSDASLAHGLIALREAPKEAADLLEQVVEQYQRSDYRRGLTSAYLYLAQSRIASAQADGARSAFDSAMAVMERQRATVGSESERTEFLDNARETIDQIVAFRASHGDSVGAFDFFENTRSRVLLERLADRAGRSDVATTQDAAKRLQRQLPAGTTVLSYAVLPTELIVWKVDAGALSMHRVPVSAAELERNVTALRRAIDGGAGDAARVAITTHLHDLLIAPLGGLDSGARIVVLPDKWLHYVPFAALRSPGGRLLVQDHEVSYIPSAAILLESLGNHRARRISSADSRVLAVGNPAFDPHVFDLPSLPASDREARDVARQYRNGRTLLDRAATDRALETLAPSVDVLHFAGHAVVRADAPQMSHLVLASSSGSGGAIFARDIASWHLDHTALVVLSGCSTSGGRISATEGASSLARAFFAAGAPAVVASLWAIDDERTADFFGTFHRRLSTGERAAAALRETQLEWIARGAPLSAWAAFQLFGD